MFRISAKLGSPNVSTALFLLALITASSAWAATNWADVPTNLTISEYLDLQFKQRYEHESNALNAYSIASFYPSSDPQNALVVVIQAWRDERVKPEDLRREIRKVGQSFSDIFTVTVAHPFISKRWKIVNPSANFVVKHVRYSDIRETLGVTFKGETVFDQDSIAKVGVEVASRGAVWIW
jgi:hypothetical protein